jgi:hypothetical protein
MKTNNLMLTLKPNLIGEEGQFLFGVIPLKTIEDSKELSTFWADKIF